MTSTRAAKTTITDFMGRCVDRDASKLLADPIFGDILRRQGLKVFNENVLLRLAATIDALNKKAVKECANRKC